MWTPASSGPPYNQMQNNFPRFHPTHRSPLQPARYPPCRGLEHIDVVVERAEDLASSSTWDTQNITINTNEFVFPGALQSLTSCQVVS